MTPIFYLHVPKTGGQTLARRLASAFPLDRSWILEGDLAFPRDNALLRDLLGNRDFIEAHVAGTFPADCAPMDILATVREPIERLISSYLHVRREPRNRLHRAAHLLSPETFFRNYASHWANQQARTLVHAIMAMPCSPMRDDSQADWLHAQVPAALRRIRWLVPTEAIDEFVPLWSHETGLHVPSPDLETNQALPDGVDPDRLRQVLGRMPELHALDLELWVRARRRMVDYRRAVLLRDVDRRSAATLAFARGEEAIWLTEGWLPPLRVGDSETEWWAGPSPTSRLCFRRRGARALRVDIAVVNGIRRGDIAAYAADGVQLPCDIEGGEEGTRLRIDLDSLGAEGEVLITVPEVYSSIEVSDTDTDTTLRSFAGRDWRLE